VAPCQPDKAAVAPQLIFNQHLDAYLTLFFVGVLWLVVLDMLRMCWRYNAATNGIAHYRNAL
jgi:carbon starvation protein